MMSSVKWTTRISFYISSQDKCIYITIQNPTKETGFHEFKVRLVELDKDDEDVKLVISDSTSQNVFIFDNLQPGRYKVTVEPKNCDSCGRITTRPITIESIPSKNIASNEKPDTTTDSTKTTTSLLVPQTGEIVSKEILYTEKETTLGKTSLSSVHAQNIASDGKPDATTDSTQTTTLLLVPHTGEITSKEILYTEKETTLAKTTLSSVHAQNIASDGNSFTTIDNTRTAASLRFAYTREITSMSSASWTNQKPGMIVGAVLGTFFGLLLVFVLVYTVYISRKRKHELRKIDPDRPAECDEPSDSTIKTFVIKETIDDLLKLPKVYIVNAEDHLPHVKAVEAFAKFLDVQCHCDVIYTPWCLREYLDDKFKWVINSIDKADFVIIVNSDLTYHQFKSWKNKENRCGNSTDPNQTFDFFMSPISQITERIINVNNPFKCIVVHFSYTADNFTLDELYTGADYLIPKHIHELICQIHQMDTRRVGYCSIGYFADLLSSTTEGQDFTKCIATASNFETQRTNSLNKNVGINLQCESNIDIDFNSFESVNCKKPSYESFLDYNINAHISPTSHNQNNVIQGNTLRQDSFEDNNAVAITDILYHQTLQNCYLLNDNFSFKAPSDTNNDDVLSQNLHQQIYDLNKRMMDPCYQNSMEPRCQHAVLSREDEAISLGGQSV
ncbi:uncharacterized protein LOC127700762 isoform X2 [Mytilus californianus]|nr:uncharacterized protein LOC127700762 isoform X2 [Mytilus californianus]XP_052060564.1 uncharacterized protein LOC127700762 isoform X2 [Mytilus californianus]XP_052060639.1 uncharacterized protein LOC127700762 isoform X2 [Mytilus californianus]